MLQLILISRQSYRRKVEMDLAYQQYNLLNFEYYLVPYDHGQTKELVIFWINLNIPNKHFFNIMVTFPCCNYLTYNVYILRFSMKEFLADTTELNSLATNFKSFSAFLRN